MWGLDHKGDWMPKNWCLVLWYWRRLLRVSWTERTSKQSILKEISPEYSLERLMLRLKLQYCGHLKWSADSLKTLMLRKIQSRRRRRWQRTKWLDGITNSVDWVWANSGRWWRIGKPGVLQSLESQRVGHNLATEKQQQPFKLTFLTTSIGWFNA